VPSPASATGGGDAVIVSSPGPVGATTGIRRREPRRGLSLLEVIVALAIFLISLVAISQLVKSALDRSIEIDVRNYGAMLAQSKIARVVSGDLPLTSVGETTDADDSDWSWSLDAAQDNIPNLYRVRVEVWRTVNGRKIEVAFSQYVLDPAKRGGTDASAIGTDDTTTGGSTTTTTGGSP